MKVAILTDTSACLTVDKIKELNIHQIELSIEFEGSRYPEKTGMTPYLRDKMLDKRTDTPVLEPISTVYLEEYFESLEKEGYDEFLYISLANGISSLPKVVSSYAKASDRKITVFDSYSSGALQGQMVELAGEMLLSGKTVSQVVDQLINLRNNNRTYMLISDIYQLMKTGYVSNGVNSMSNLFLRPLTMMKFNENGKLAMVNTHYREKKAYSEVLELIISQYHSMNDQMRITLMGDENNSQFDELYELLQENFPTAKIEKDELPISLAIYTGKKSIGISFGLDWKTVLYE
ncbi:DegV family protein [Ligilactobacillus salivarius]|uniref:DegV family protein n=1 Tax=Ligilactobacillus salivarius TaxID=1624 RepID=UPI002672EA11|nr:DegV family protein [Ligilactobacillus salivarius]